MLTAESLASLDEPFERLAIEARESLLNQGVAEERVRITNRLHLKYEGTDTTLELVRDDSVSLATLVEEFENSTSHVTDF